MLMLEGLKIMLIGMSVVALILIILVICMYTSRMIVSKIDKIFPPKSEAAPVVATSNNSNQEIAIAIALAKTNKK